ncbi:small Rab5-like GTP-binding protein [Hamiltosporidium tvaerminnensis]|uniref:Small Rab5-like GTP-binding protein n=2 Tax=Hamiltosporidium TaxID=1176354 RepID=A0A4Q9LDB4_9MICR|nr:hypothetical protein LUQ84_000145 [Hamiltosporidium tvaerminnensis]TBU05959.1 small Rab5-like GTP-binding protein [Hamiltosporidium magnivora]TBU03835.1 small Rab5-like GTP-binding protein [Hamiltosporidium tvaerminnensis]TBU07907.1 small Rab5-like GTP-binding protein [Hamiltosporidium magnivora]TBU11220.1 small Rab5-like GTP-binding protein [Hamiltosporidium tvaerminnensis]
MKTDIDIMEYSYKLVVLGYYSVGKSCLVMKYVKGEFNSNEESTIGAAFLTKSLFSNGASIKYEIWDTAGQERYNSLIPMYYRGAHVAFIVYDITSRESFETAKKWVEELKVEKPKDFIKILVGNKMDLCSLRKINYEEGKTYADSQGLRFYETSAKTGHNVKKIFFETAELLPRKEVEPKIAKINIKGGKRNFSCC